MVPGPLHDHLDPSAAARRVYDALDIDTRLPVEMADLACLAFAFTGWALARGVAHLFRRNRSEATSTTEEWASDVRRSRVHGHAVVS